MNRSNEKTYLAPYRDPSGLGFTLALPNADGFPARRQLTIVAVCWNFIEDRALFINAAGLVVPSWHNRDALALLLRQRTIRQEFGCVIGEGQFAMKPAEIKAMESSGRIKSWLVHYLEEPAGYLDDASTWATYVEKDQAAARDGFVRIAEEFAALQRRQRFSVDDVDPNAPQASDVVDDGEALRQQLDQRQAEIEAMRTKALADDARIAAWLRGDVGTPPLLALMQGRAAR